MYSLFGGQLGIEELRNLLLLPVSDTDRLHRFTRVVLRRIHKHLQSRADTLLVLDLKPLTKLVFVLFLRVFVIFIVELFSFLFLPPTCLCLPSAPAPP